MTNAMRIALYTPAAVIALAPAGALAVDYMNAEQAQKLMFVQADAFEVREIPLDALAKATSENFFRLFGVP